jgi:hypothetical protein
MRQEIPLKAILGEVGHDVMWLRLGNAYGSAQALARKFGVATDFDCMGPSRKSVRVLGTGLVALYIHRAVDASARTDGLSGRSDHNLNIGIGQSLKESAVSSRSISDEIPRLNNSGREPLVSLCRSSTRPPRKRLARSSGSYGNK